MRPYRRALLYAGLALAVPLPALALGGDRQAAGAGVDLGVSASLDSCGVLDGAVVCKLDASWHPAPGATRYTASVTTPNGTVIDYGEVPEGAAGIWVKYAGAGTYRVTISAWGKPQGARRAQVVAEDGTEAAPTGEGDPASSAPDPAVAAEPAQPELEAAQADAAAPAASESRDDAGEQPPPEEGPVECAEPAAPEEAAAVGEAEAEAANVAGDDAACPVDEPLPAG